MKSKIWLTLGAIVFMLGCHSVPSHAPTASVPREPQWAVDYKWARNNQLVAAEKACEIFTNLSGKSDFPVPEMAKLRAVETCPVNQFPNFTRKELPNYLQDQSIDVFLKLAAARQDKNGEIEWALEKSKLKIPQTEKIKWINIAIQDAETLKLEEKSKELRQRLYSIAPRLNPEPSRAQYLAVAGDWRSVRQFKKARDYYEKVIVSREYELEDKIKALKGIRLSYKNARDNDQHLNSAGRLIDFIKRELKTSPDSKALWQADYEAKIYEARAQWTLGHTTQTKAAYEKLEKQLKGKVSLTELYWLEGRLTEETGDPATASKFYEQSLKEKSSDPDLHDKVLWSYAWNERRRGNLPHAIEIFNEVDKTTQTDFTRQRILFWLGKTYAENKQEDEAKKVFQRLLDVDPLGYYGLLAHRQLNTPIVLKTAIATSESETNVLSNNDKKAADGLSVIGEKEALTSLLDIASQTYKKRKDQSDDGWVTVFKYYAKGGLYMKLYESLGTLTPERRKNILEGHPELLFPQPWVEEVRQASNQFGVPPELIYSIIRQESAFDMRARSLADAFGLMQLLPEIAEELGPRYKIPYKEMEDLYDPKTNISFGAAYLKELFNRQKGQFILGVASYNASENVIRNWMKNRFHGDSLEFIEDIPYEETRSYVRLVMRNLIFYSLINSKTASIEFPAWVLKLEGV